MSDFLINKGNQIRSLNDQVKTLFRNELKRYPDFLAKAKNPWTTEILWNYVSRFEDLHNAIMELAETSNVYGIKILFRSFIEHWLVALYIFDQSKHNDETAEHFEKHYLIWEFMMFEKAGAQIEAIKKGEKSKVDLANYISSKHEVLKGFDKDNQKEISKAIEKFSMKNIINHFFQQYQQSKNDVASFYLKLVPEYAKLSSFTHGGPYASKLVDAYLGEGQVDEEINNALTISFLGSVSAKENLILNLIEKNDAKEYMEFYKKTSAIRELALDKSSKRQQ